MNFTQYLDTEYKELYPQPKKQLAGLDWQFYATVVHAIAAILLSSLRTGQLFYSAAMLSAAQLGLSGALEGVVAALDFVVAMFAIEGGLVIYSSIRSVARREVKSWIYSLLIGLLLVISVAAGLGQSMGLADVPPEFRANFMAGLSVVIGAGASVVAWLAGEVLGVQILRFQAANTDAGKAHARAMASWLSRGRKEWQVRRKELLMLPQPEPREVGQHNVEREQHKTLIGHYLQRIAAREKRVPGAAEIGRATGLPSNYVQKRLDEIKDGRP